MKKIISIMFFSLFILGFSGSKISTKEIPRVPEWAKTAVWYQIFPERFANGDKSNDPTPHEMDGIFHPGLQIGLNCRLGKKLMATISTGTVM